MTNKYHIKGRLFAKNSSSFEEAEIYIFPGEQAIFLTSGAIKEEKLDLNTLDISSRIAHIPRKITLPNGQIFESDDNDGVDEALKSYQPNKSRFSIHSLERPGKKLAIFAILAIALVYGLTRYGVPIGAKFAAMVTPPAAIALMDKPVLKTLDNFLKPSKLPESRQKEITRIFESLVSHAPKNAFTYKLLFRRGGILGPNALALPGGTIVITDELIQLSKYEDEIAAVLGHEITHVEKRHSMQQIYRIAGVALLVSALTGDGESFVEEVAAAGTGLLHMSHSRSAESEADRGGILIMKSAGRDPEKLATILESMTRKMCGEELYKACGKSSWLSSHPGTIDRAKKIRKLSK